MAVMQAESGCIADRDNTGLNTNGSVDRGLFQINSVHAAKVNGDLSSLFNPEINVRIAHQIYQGSGWKAWSAYKNGAYLKFY